MNFTRNNNWESYICLKTVCVFLKTWENVFLYISKNLNYQWNSKTHKICIFNININKLKLSFWPPSTMQDVMLLPVRNSEIILTCKCTYSTTLKVYTRTPIPCPVESLLWWWWYCPFKGKVKHWSCYQIIKLTIYYLKVHLASSWFTYESFLEKFLLNFLQLHVREKTNIALYLQKSWLLATFCYL